MMNGNQSLNFGLRAPTFNAGANVGNQQSFLNWNTPQQPSNGMGTNPLSFTDQSVVEQPNLFSAEGMFGKGQGWLSGGMGVAQGLAGTFLGMKNFGLAKDQLEQSKKYAQTNLSNTARATNSRLFDTMSNRYGDDRGQQELLKWGVSGDVNTRGYQPGAASGGSGGNGFLTSNPSPTNQSRTATTEKSKGQRKERQQNIA